MPPTRISTLYPARAVFEYYLTTYRRVWRGTVFSSFVLPVMFFLGIGLMVGEYVDRGGALDVPYLEFVGPGLLAFTGVQIAMLEASYPVMGGFKWHKTYYAIAAAPPRAGDIVAGQLGYVGLRTAISSVAFLLVMIPFGVVSSGWAVLAPVAALVVGLAVAAPVMAFSAAVAKENSLALLFRFALLPMMLFSGVFFPVDQLPEALASAVQWLPMAPAINLIRPMVLGELPANAGWAILQLVVTGGLAVWVAAGLLRRRLLR